MPDIQVDTCSIFFGTSLLLSHDVMVIFLMTRPGSRGMEFPFSTEETAASFCGDARFPQVCTYALSRLMPVEVVQVVAIL